MPYDAPTQISRVMTPGPCSAVTIMTSPGDKGSPVADILYM